jgi:hypothetical protein
MSPSAMSPSAKTNFDHAVVETAAPLGVGMTLPAFCC